jgi:hypothetical protein
MIKAIVLLPFLVLGIGSSAIAQLPEPQGSASELMGVQARSVKDANLPTPATVTLPGIARSQATFKNPLGNFDIRSGGIERRQNPNDVFPKAPSEYDSGMKILYRIDQQ